VFLSCLSPGFYLWFWGRLIPMIIKSKFAPHPLLKGRTSPIGIGDAIPEQCAVVPIPSATTSAPIDEAKDGKMAAPSPAASPEAVSLNAFIATLPAPSAAPDGTPLLTAVIFGSWS
jgi:hypothetical protein